MLERYLNSAAATEALGARLASALAPGCVLYLRGDLGAGKTTLARGLLRGLGHPGTVKSPTFTLVEPYQLGRWRLFHWDLYRLADPEELEYLGLRDQIDGEAVLLIEWPERGRGELPAADLEVWLDYADEGRALSLIHIYPCRERPSRRIPSPSAKEQTLGLYRCPGPGLN